MYTFMLDPDLLAALKVAKEREDKSEGAIVREALREWFERNGVKVKSDRKRVATRKRP
jgi:hypothetical protein